MSYHLIRDKVEDPQGRIMEASDKVELNRAYRRMLSNELGNFTLKGEKEDTEIIIEIISAIKGLCKVNGINSELLFSRVEHKDSVLGGFSNKVITF